MKHRLWQCILLDICILQSALLLCDARRYRSGKCLHLLIVVEYTHCLIVECGGRLFRVIKCVRAFTLYESKTVLCSR